MENLILLAQNHLFYTMFVYFCYVGCYVFFFKVYILRLTVPAYLVEPYCCAGIEQFMFAMLIVVS